MSNKSDIDDEIVPVEDLHKFVDLLVSWHLRRVAICHHFKDIPVGSEIQIEDEEVIVMEGPFLDGFKLGIDMALNQLGELPFVAQAPPDEVH